MVRSHNYVPLVLAALILSKACFLKRFCEFGWKPPIPEVSRPISNAVRAMAVKVLFVASGSAKTI